MSEVQPFTFPATAQQIRVVVIDGEPWFVASDVCRVLGYAHTASALRALREQERGVHPMHTPGGEQEISVISEPGLYRLAMRSNRPEAEAFQDWVTGEVLPTIRRTGGFGRPPVDISTITRRDLAVMLIEAEDARELAERRAAELEAASAQMAPKVEAFDAFMESDGSYSMATVANMLGIGRTTLFRRLREDGILQRDNRPYQRYAHHFRVVGGSHDRNGHEVPHYTTYVLPTGVDFIRRRLFPPGSQLTLVV